MLMVTMLSRVSMLLFLWFVLPLSSSDAQVSSHKDNYPPMWELVPENLTDFTIQNEKVFINPWDYLERMGIYKILLNVTAPFLGMKEPENKKNILWGLPLQNGWQFVTGRLQDPTKQPLNGQNIEDHKSISTKSWWACMNYYLSVVPFFGAVDAGLFEGFPYGIVITHPDESTDLCHSIEECRASSSKALGQWKAFFEVIKTSNQISDMSVPPLSKEEDIFLSYMWRAHVESINAALPLCSQRLSYLSGPERCFGRDWATTVEFLAATNFPTNFQSTNDFQIFLPNRILLQNDKAPNISDFSEQENRVLSILHFINQVNTFTAGHLLSLWKKAMCSEQGRAAGRNLLQNIITNPHLAPQAIITIIIELAKNSVC